MGCYVVTTDGKGWVGIEGGRGLFIARSSVAIGKWRACSIKYISTYCSRYCSEMNDFGKSVRREALGVFVNIKLFM